MDNILPIYKEVYINKSSSAWLEIKINTGGIPTTLQDIKAQERSGGFAYKNHSNRFIYWRTNHNVLELVEDSLDINLAKNQVRYTFTDSPILEGVTIVETSSSIVILIPTLCSVHRLAFPHPGTMSKSTNSPGILYSIFSSATEAEANSPNTYIVLTNIPSSVVSGACHLVDPNNAVFALSLKNSYVLLVRMGAGGDNVTVTALSGSSVVPRIFSGIQNAFMGKAGGGRHLCLSLLFHSLRGRLFLFAVESEGKLSAWDCQTSTNTSVHLFEPTSVTRQNCKLCQVEEDGDSVLLIACYQDQVSVIRAQLQSGSLQMNCLMKHSIVSSEALTLVDIVIERSNRVWFSWNVGHDSSVVACLELDRQSDDLETWSRVVMSKPQEFKHPSDIKLDPAQLYLDKVMNSGFGNAPDFTLNLPTLRTEEAASNDSDIRERIRVTVDSEIYVEATETFMDDAEFISVSEMVWSRLYRSCIQFISSGLRVNGLLWLPSCGSLVLIKQHGYSIVRELFPLEKTYYQIPYKISVSGEDTHGFGPLVEILQKFEVPDALDKLNLGLHLGECMEEHYIQPVLALVPDIGNYLSDSIRGIGTLDASIKKLFEYLVPESGSKICSDGIGFTSAAGISAAVSTFYEICSLRLRVSECLCLLLYKTSGPSLAKYCDLAVELCQQYHPLVWACQTPVSTHASVLHSFLVAHPHIGLPTLQDTIINMFNILSPLSNSITLANHLLSLKRYDLIQCYANLVDYSSWKLILIESYLATGEPRKPFNLVCENTHDMSFYLKAIALYERFSYPDYIISLVISLLRSNQTFSQSDLETLHSVRFVQELRLGHYDVAFSIVNAISDTDKRSDFLHRLILDLISCSRFEIINSFSFYGIEDEIERILTVRARSLDIIKAQPYYTLLYSLHTKLHNYKKASSIMYEQALRAETSEDQWKSLSICVNSLSLLSPKEAFIVKPRTSEEDLLEVIDLKEMELKLELSKYRFYLGCSPDDSVEEMVSKCISSKLFTQAIKLGVRFKLDMGVAMEAYVAEVIKLSEPQADFKWLAANNDDHTEHTISKENRVKAGWRLVEQAVYKFERASETRLHRAVANQLLRTQCHLPLWLLNSYKKRNCGELLRLYLKWGALSSGSDLAVQLLVAATSPSHHSSHGLYSYLHPSQSPLWLPLHAIHRLLTQLRARKMSDDLEAAINEYVQIAKSVHEMKIRSAFSSDMETF